MDFGKRYLVPDLALLRGTVQEPVMLAAPTTRLSSRGAQRRRICSCPSSHSAPALQLKMNPMQEACYFTYIMASRSRTLYIGVTGDLRRRVFQHKWKEHDGFTARYHCDRLVWFERHQYVQSAIAREKELKGWGRAKKIALIESLNAAWVDLSRDWYDYEPADYRRALDEMNS